MVTRGHHVGNSPAIQPSSLTSTRYNQGQVCCATSRILVQEGIYDKFVEAFAEHVKNTSVVGDPWKDDTFQGPQVTKAQYDRVLSYIESGKTEGAKLVSGGEAYKNVGGKGFFVSPTIFTDVKDHMTIYREEVFGPFVVVSSFKTEEEAIERANDSTYGLGAALFTQNIAKAHRVARLIEAGMVWINSSNDSDLRIPFGGVKQSGIGRELGEAGLEAYTNKKVCLTLLIKWNAANFLRLFMSIWALSSKSRREIPIDIIKKLLQTFATYDPLAHSVRALTILLRK